MTRTMIPSRRAVVDEHQPSGQRRLELVAAVFTAAVLVHNLDHLRRGAGATPGDVSLLGSLGIVVEVGVVIAIFVRHRLAPAAATLVGFALAAGYLFVHFTPRRSWLSDSFLVGGVDAFSQIAALVETLVAVVLATVGLQVLRQRLSTGTATETVVRRAAHPVVAAMTIGNLLILMGVLLAR